MRPALSHFLHDERAAVTVDWTVLSAAAVAVAIATTAILTDGIEGLTGRLDGELREQNLSDNFVVFLSGHFEQLIASTDLTEEAAGLYFDEANQLLNNEIRTNLEAGVTQMVEGTLPEDDLPILVALASVAQQRNIVDDDYLNYYFDFDGSGEGMVGLQ